MKYIKFYPVVEYPFIVYRGTYCGADKIKSAFRANKTSNKNKTALK